MIVCISLFEGYRIFLLDFVAAYLNTPMPDEVKHAKWLLLDRHVAGLLMKRDAKHWGQFLQADGRILVRMKHILYGYKEAAHHWNQLLMAIFEGKGLAQTTPNSCMLTRRTSHQDGLRVIDSNSGQQQYRYRENAEAARSGGLSNSGLRVGDLNEMDRGKKRKVFHDGMLSVRDDLMVILSSETGQDILKKKLHDKERHTILCGNSIELGQYDVQIDSENTLKGSGFKDEDVKDEDKKLEPLMAKKPFLVMKPTSSSLYSKPLGSLENVSLPHSSVITSCLVSSMQSGAASETTLSLTNNQRGETRGLEVEHGLKRHMRPHQLRACEFLFKVLENDFEGGSEFDIGGAILADEMGLGKSLTAIAIMWAYIRRDKSRCVVVCPSSLVNNWGKEFKKWLGVKCNPLCVGAGIQACETIKTFKSGHISMTPVLIISYEMYRKHCLLINEVREIKLLVCDEAHRLKNIFGTQTTEAFTSLSTCRRLIITGTPIQNNLEELYSLVSFVKPNYLGTRQYFKREYLEPIISCREEGVSLRKKEQGEAALDALHARLAKIMLQRSQDEVLRALLPEKTVYAVVCHMTGAQAAKYETAANELLTLMNEGASGGVLAGMQKLRSLASYSHSASTSSEEATTVHSILAGSVKLRILVSLLIRIRAMGDKVVLVSNFTTHLDHIETLAVAEGWRTLRIDGQVASSARQSLIDRFNSKTDATFVFLLSSRAGGVGINLIGANRLIMLDCDWNPAIDLQAMSRVWREGQTKKVFIYRLFAGSSIEASILNRQTQKIGIATAVKSSLLFPSAEAEAENNMDEVEADGVISGSEKELLNMNPSTIQDLIFPPCGKVVTLIDGNIRDEVLREVVLEDAERGEDRYITDVSTPLLQTISYRVLPEAQIK